MKAHQPIERPISRYEAMVNGYGDRSPGDAGEWPTSERPADYFSDAPISTGDPEIDSMNEPQIAAALSGVGIH